MRRLCFSAALILLALLILPCLPGTEEAGIYDRVLRLHVIAASDSETDQTAKLAVRDALLSEITPLVADCRSVEEAAACLRDARDHLTAIAAETVAARGQHYGAEIRLDKERYPTRSYEAAALPAGEYLSLRVILGEGEGQNWWCVLFPPLCQAPAMGEDDTEARCIAAGLTPEQYRLITGIESGSVRYRVRFRVLEILEQMLSRLRGLRA